LIRDNFVNHSTNIGTFLGIGTAYQTRITR